MTPITADNLTPAKHGFFTRQGGVSTGMYDSLNCGEGSADNGEDVAVNRARVAGHFGLNGRALLSLHQVHSPDVVHVTGPFSDGKPKADAMVTTVPGLVLGALSADCAPVLFEDRAAGVIAAAHAGWKGALAGVLEATTEAMVSAGANRGSIRAAVGPCLSQRNYEVGPEFVETFMDQDPDFAQYFAGSAGDRAMFDLPRFALDRLRTAGISNPEWTGHCTYADPNRFFSYRRSCHDNMSDYGRLVAAITL